MQGLKRNFHLEETAGSDLVATDRARLQAQPNARFLDFITSHDDARTARLILDSPDYQSFKYAIVGTLNGCWTLMGNEVPQPEKFFPEKLWQDLQPTLQDVNQTFNDYYTRENNKACYEKTLTRYKKEAVAFRAIFAARGIPTGTFFSSIHYHNPLFLLSGKENTRWSHIMAELKKRDPDLKDLEDISDRSLGKRINNCKFLQKKSRQALADYELPKSAASASFECVETTPPPLDAPQAGALGDAATALTFAKCVACHTNGTTNAPPIPFNSRQGLQDWLNQRPARRTEIKELIGPQVSPHKTPMPAIGELEDFERKAIEDYLERR